MRAILALSLLFLREVESCSDTWCLDEGCCRSRAVCAIPYIAQPSYRRRRAISEYDCEKSYICCPPCSQYTCPTGYFPKNDSKWIGGYSTEECCYGPFCSIFECPFGYVLKPDANTTFGASSEVCCQSTSTSTTSTKTVTTVTKTTTVTTTVTSTTSTSSSPPMAPGSAAAAAAAVQAAIREGARTLIKGALTNSSSASLETAVGKLTMFSLDKLGTDGGPSSVPVEGGSKVTLSKNLMNSLPKGTVLSTLAIRKQGSNSSKSIVRKVEDDPFANLAGDAGEALSAPTMDISMFNSDADQLEVASLKEKPLLFKLPEVRDDKGRGEPDCVFLETTENGTVKWSRKGVRRATLAEIQAAGEAPFGVWCITEHLSVFGAITALLIGCMNFELLTPPALAAVYKHDDWWTYRPSILVFCIAGSLLSLLAFGSLRETWFLRWGWVQPDPRAQHHPKPKIGIRDLLSNNCAQLETQTMIAGVQRLLSVRTGITTGCVAKQCWDGRGWIDSKVALPRTVFFHKLEFYSGGVEQVIMNELCIIQIRSVVWRFIATWKAMHPLLDSIRAGTTTVMKRVTLFATTIVGVLASNAMIFNFSGSMRSWEADVTCPFEPASRLFIIVAVIASIILNVIPNTILKVVAKPAGKKKICNILFWVLTFLYLALSTVICVSALANMNPLDQTAWYAAIEWAMYIKLLAVPTAKAMKDALLLEFFLFKDKSQCRRFLVSVGLRNAKEKTLEGKAQETVEKIARQAISAEELVKFMALLGEKVMLDYEPETSTSEDVINGAIKLLSIKPPSFQELPLHIEVVEARMPIIAPGAEVQPLSCSVLHLGKKARFQRLCIDEHRSSATLPVVEGSMARCAWAFEASVVGLELDHALGFRVSDRGRIIGIGCLTLEEVLQGRGFCGELLLHPPGAGHVRAKEESEAAGNLGRVPLPIELFTVPAQAGAMAPMQPPRISVKVHMPLGYLQALALHELRKLKGWQPEVTSGGPRERTGFRADLVRTVAEQATDGGWSPALSGGAFCKPCNYKEGCVPPDRMVVHCRKGNFLHFVTCLLSDAMGSDESYTTIRNKLVTKDFLGVLEDLRKENRQGVRFWVDMFAMDLLGGHQDLTNNAQSNWHEQLLAALPSIIRVLKRDCCNQMVADIKANAQPRCSFPKQLLIMDRNFWLMREHTALAEIMLTKSMDVKQRVIFHPDHMQGTSLGDCLSRVAEELQLIKGGSMVDQPWTLQYLENRQEVYDTLKHLVVDGVKDKKKDSDDSILEELNLSDVGVTIMAHQASLGAADMAAHAMDMGAQQLENLQV